MRLAPRTRWGRINAGAKLNTLRLLRRWSPESLARLAGLPVATIGEIESGVGLVELGELEALARAFGLTLSALRVPPGRPAEEQVMLASLEGEA